MSASVIPAFLVALRTQLMAREGLAGVGVFTAPPGDELPPEALVVDRITSEQEWAALGRGKREETFVAFLIVHASVPGTGEDVCSALRARTYELKGEVEGALRDDVTVGGTVRVAALVRDELRQGAGSGTRWAQIELQIEASQRI